MSSKNLYGREPYQSLDSKLDQLIETGRQVVDGFSGNRPGQRDNRGINRKKPYGLKNVGRWVEDKLEWLLEEEEEDWVDADEKIYTSGMKKPLEAISRRIPSPQSEPFLGGQTNPELNTEQWPEESLFRVNRWERSKRDSRNNTSSGDQDMVSRKQSSKRRLPRSSRRR